MQNIFTDNQFIPHIHCLNGNETLVYGIIITNTFTAILYFLIAYALGKLSRWDKQGFYWRSMWYNLSLVFIFCALNYIMQMVVIWYPIYYIQLIIASMGVGVSGIALWRFIQIRKEIPMVLQALKDTIVSFTIPK